MTLQLDHPISVNDDAITAVTRDKPICRRMLLSFANRYLLLSMEEIDNASGQVTLVTRDIVFSCLQQWCNKLDEKDRNVGKVKECLDKCGNQSNKDIVLAVREILSTKSTTDKLTDDILQDVAGNIGSEHQWADMYKRGFGGTIADINSYQLSERADLVKTSEGIWNRWIENTQPTLWDLVCVLERAKQESGHISAKTVEAVRAVLKKSERRIYRYIDRVKLVSTQNFQNIYSIPNHIEQETTYKLDDFCIDFTLNTYPTRKTKNQASTRELRLQEIFDLDETRGQESVRIFIQGEQGSGKSFISRQITLAWASDDPPITIEDMKRFSLVVYIDAYRTATDETLIEYIRRSYTLDNYVTAEELQHWMASLEPYTCFVIDNYIEHLHRNNQICSNLISKTIYSRSTLILLSSKEITSPSEKVLVHLKINPLRGNDIKNFLNLHNKIMLKSFLDFNIRHRFLRQFVSRPRYLWYFLELYKAKQCEPISMTDFFRKIIQWQCEVYKKEESFAWKNLGKFAYKCLCTDDNDIQFDSTDDIETIGLLNRHRKTSLMDGVSFTFQFADESMRNFLAAQWIVEQSANSDIDMIKRTLTEVGATTSRNDILPFVCGLLHTAGSIHVLVKILQEFAFASVKKSSLDISSVLESEEHLFLKCLAECADEKCNVHSTVRQFLGDLIPTLTLFKLDYSVCVEGCFIGLSVILNYKPDSCDIECVYNGKSYKGNNVALKRLLDELRHQKRIEVEGNDFNTFFEHDVHLEQYHHLDTLKINGCSGSRKVCAVKTKILEISNCNNSFIACIEKSAENKVIISECELSENVLASIFCVERFPKISVEFKQVQVDLLRAVELMQAASRPLSNVPIYNEHVDLSMTCKATISMTYEKGDPHGIFHSIHVNTCLSDSFSVEHFEKLLVLGHFFGALHIHCTSPRSSTQLFTTPAIGTTQNLTSLTLEQQPESCIRQFIPHVFSLAASVDCVEICDNNRTMLKHQNYKTNSLPGNTSKWLYVRIEPHLNLEQEGKSIKVWKKLLTPCLQSRNLFGLSIMCSNSNDFEKAIRCYQDRVDKHERQMNRKEDSERNRISPQTVEFITGDDRCDVPDAPTLVPGVELHRVFPNNHSVRNPYLVHAITCENALDVRVGEILDHVDL